MVNLAKDKYTDCNCDGYALGIPGAHRCECAYSRRVLRSAFREYPTLSVARVELRGASARQVIGASGARAYVAGERMAGHTSPLIRAGK